MTPSEVVVLIVSDDRAVVEADLAAGRLLCPRWRSGVLGGWGCSRLREGRAVPPHASPARKRFPVGSLEPCQVPSVGDLRVVPAFPEGMLRVIAGSGPNNSRFYVSELKR